jgi:hypothetical protein
VGPSEPACRSRLQTASESWRSRVAVRSVRGKGAHDVSGESHGDERKRTDRRSVESVGMASKLGAVVAQDEPRRSLLMAWVVPGVKAA